MIEVDEGALRIECRFELLVGGAVVYAPEFLFGEKGGGIERFAAAELLHDAFDPAVKMSGGLV